MERDMTRLQSIIYNFIVISFFFHRAVAMPNLWIRRLTFFGNLTSLSVLLISRVTVQAWISSAVMNSSKYTPPIQQVSPLYDVQNHIYKIDLTLESSHISFHLYFLTAYYYGACIQKHTVASLQCAIVLSS